MTIQTISRDWGVAPSIVRILTDDSLSDILADGYLDSQETVIKALNNGAFDWDDSDMVAIAYADGKGIFDRDSDGNLSFAAGASQQTTVTLTAAQVNGMYAAPVEIIPAPGADQLIRVHDVELVVNYGGAQFANGGVVALQYDDTINGAGLDASADLAAVTLNGFAADSTVGLAGESESGAAAAKVGMGIFISNETGAFDTGTSTVQVTVWYSVLNANLA